MRLRFSVDLKACWLAGTDRMNGETTLDIHPLDVQLEDRKLIADLLLNGCLVCRADPNQNNIQPWGVDQSGTYAGEDKPNLIVAKDATLAAERFLATACSITQEGMGA